jgi:hypothetical protein
MFVRACNRTAATYGMQHATVRDATCNCTACNMQLYAMQHATMACNMQRNAYHAVHAPPCRGLRLADRRGDQAEPLGANRFGADRYRSATDPRERCGHEPLALCCAAGASRPAKAGRASTLGLGLRSPRWCIGVFVCGVCSWRTRGCLLVRRKSCRALPTSGRCIVAINVYCRTPPHRTTAPVGTRPQRCGAPLRVVLRYGFVCTVVRAVLSMRLPSAAGGLLERSAAHVQHVAPPSPPNGNTRARTRMLACARVVVHRAHAAGKASERRRRRRACNR